MTNTAQSNNEARDNDFYTLLAAGVKYKRYPIVCTTPYEFEGRVFAKGEISDQCWGRNIPDGWSRATAQDITSWYERQNACS